MYYSILISVPLGKLGELDSSKFNGYINIRGIRSQYQYLSIHLFIYIHLIVYMCVTKGSIIVTSNWRMVSSLPTTSLSFTGLYFSILSELCSKQLEYTYHVRTRVIRVRK